ncbi:MULTISPECIES: hypothetical protein [unclassified Dysgonomonas]|uniref:hypothetical protein n=1 Tax=unclassified Dysgonomonas TaxID=2630389 RepID=UPI0025C1A683|nr:MULTISPECIES: hypothetical protein [unclassified Dysgonomonas]MDR2001753.1 hypothetical protein [Prevotella sp.]HMM03129.1 hypothetical protein [Dysgonomonas sp.]
MNKRYYLQFFYLPALLYLSSCTYDYFEDETNYEIYVPKADKNIRTETYSIEDLSIFIYNDELKKERYSDNPFSENARSRLGNFNFRLYPGSYNVYCFTNAQGTLFQDLNIYSQARFDLQQSTDGTYKEPSAIYLEYRTPTINFPGPVVSDTAFFERKYVGRICIAFKNLFKLDASLTYTNIKKIDIEASGVGVTQYLLALKDSTSTRSSRNSTSDIMRLSGKTFDVEYKDFEFGVQNYYFPSPDLSGEGREREPIVLKLNFIGQSDNTLSVLTIPFTDKMGIPIVLHMNETHIIEVDGNNIQIMRLEDPEKWNPQIETEENSGPGGGGIGV